MDSPARFFQTVPKHDCLGFWVGGILYAKGVADFLDLDKKDVAKIAGVAVASVRFDRKMPVEVRRRLEELAITISLVAQFFQQDATKTALWFRTRNPVLGQVSPRDMIRAGRFEKVQRFVLEAVMESRGLPAAGVGQTNDGRLSAAPVQSSQLGADHPLIAFHRGAIDALCERFGVRRLAAFGSILRQNFDAVLSDVDFVVEFKPFQGLSPARQYFDFKSELERVLHRPVDLVELSAMPDSRLKRIIERTQVPVYGQAA